MTKLLILNGIYNKLYLIKSKNDANDAVIVLLDYYRFNFSILISSSHPSGSNS